MAAAAATDGEAAGLGLALAAGLGLALAAGLGLALSTGLGLALSTGLGLAAVLGAAGDGLAALVQAAMTNATPASKAATRRFEISTVTSESS